MIQLIDIQGVLNIIKKGGVKMFKTRLVLIACLAIAFSLVSLVSVNAQQAAEKKTESKVEVTVTKEELPLIGESRPYTIGKEDVLTITVQNQAEFTGRYIVGPDGKIQYSYAGDIQAEGLTKEELRQVLVEKLGKFVKAPTVSITISEYKSKNIYILGEVRGPGKYPMSGDTVSLRDAIVEAGLPTPGAALRRTYIIMQSSKKQKPNYKKVDLVSVLYHGKEKYNVDLFPGDIVVVPSTVPSEINRALSVLLSPFSRARDADILMEHRWGAGDDGT